jgi:hypothetical protein
MTTPMNMLHYPLSQICFTQYGTGKKVLNEVGELEAVINTYGYRSDEFEDVENNFLFSGCSFTWGAGLPNNSSWAYYLNKKLGGERFHSLAQSGNSAENIIDNIYRFIRQFGKPKGIFVLFPNLERFCVYERKDDGISFMSYLFHDHNPDYHPLLDDQSDIDFIREKVFLPTYVEYSFLNRVKQLEEYLNLLGVPFGWSTWSYDTLRIIDPFQFDNYEPLEGYMLGNGIPISIKNKVYEYIENNLPEPGEEPWWLEAADKPLPHPGIGEQKFYAESMFKAFGEKVR